MSPNEAGSQGQFRGAMPVTSTVKDAMVLNIGSLMVIVGCIATLSGCQKSDASRDQPQGGNVFPTEGVVLPVSEAASLLSACDGTVAQADSLWIPSDSIIEEMEVRLARFLRRGSGDPLHQYSRQYLGLYRGDRPLVFVNGVHQRYLQGVVDRDSMRGVTKPIRIEQTARWFRERAVRICDGGELSFHAEYDVAADSVAAFEFNGTS